MRNACLGGSRQPSGKYLGEAFHQAGGVPAVMGEMLKAGMLHGECLTVSGKTVAANLDGWGTRNDDVIRPVDAPLRQKAGFRVIRGNLFDSAIMKTSTISEDFQRRYLDSTDAGPEGILEARAIVFEARLTLTASNVAPTRDAPLKLTLRQLAE